MVHSTDGGPPGLDLDALAAFAVSAVREAGTLTLRHFRADAHVDDKAEPGAFDPVTAADRDAEALIRRRIRARFPRHGLYGEEQGWEPGAEPLTWMIDPVDGTRGFIGGFVQWGTMLGLWDGQAALLGVVHQPYTGEIWCGTAAGTVFQRWPPGAPGTPMDNRRCRVRHCAGLGDALLATTDPNLFQGAEADAFHRVRRAVRLSRYGADCYAYCLLAMGSLDLVIESGLKPWDVRPLMPIVTGAGGRLTDWSGGDPGAGGQVVAAGDERVHREALALLATAAARD